MPDHNIDQLAEDALNSIEGIRRAEPAPFFLTRLNARLHAKHSMNAWNKISLFLSRPVVSVSILLIIILVNSFIIINGNRQVKQGSENTSIIKDDFAISDVSIYDIENQESDEGTNHK